MQVAGSPERRAFFFNNTKTNKMKWIPHLLICIYIVYISLMIFKTGDQIVGLIGLFLSSVFIGTNIYNIYLDNKNKTK